jgi:ABC-type transport system involved in multi-copper enzyme maturation permease subunit
MTVGTVTPYQPGQQTGRDGFTQLLRAEWTKFRTVRGWVIGMTVAVLVTAGLGLFAAVGTSSSCQSMSGSSAGPARTGSACGRPTFPVGPGGVPVDDSFYFVRQPLTGNGSITVQVTSLTGLLPSANPTVQAGPNGPADTRPGLVPWAKAGLIIKNGTSQGSAYAAMMVTADHGVRMQDNYTNDTAGQPGAVSPASPRWLRLTRSGDTITGYDSADGAHWTQVGTVHLAGLASTVQAGLFAASPAYTVESQGFGGGTNGSSLPSQATAVFDHLSRSGTWPGGTWTGDHIGAGPEIGVGPESEIGGYHQAGGRFTVTGSGDIAPVIAGSGNEGDPAATLTNYLIGTFAGLIAVIVVATMFITAEYRRGLIRITLTTSPRRGRVLAAKALVIGSVTFVAGLVAAAAAVIFGAQLSRHKGTYVFPASWATELRVIAGTAALLAVVAVLALALGTVLRRSAAAVTLVIVIIVLPYIMGVASVLPASASEWLLRITPAAAFAILQAAPQYPQVNAIYTPTSGYFPLAPWAGLAVLCGYAALCLGLAVVLLRRRDA